jgi:hypothetical protein
MVYNLAVKPLQHFLERSATAPPERDGRNFRVWQRVSTQLQREIRALVARTFFADEARIAADLDRAFTMAVYSSCQPHFGERPMEFTYDLGNQDTLPLALRSIGRALQARLAEVSAGIHSDPRLKRRFAPVWHVDIVNVVKSKPRMLIELLAREAVMINALIALGTRRDQRTAKRLQRSAEAAVRVMGVDSQTLCDLLLSAGAENLRYRRILESDHLATAGSPDTGVGGDEDRDHGRADSRGQMADPGVVSDIQACC